MDEDTSSRNRRQQEERYETNLGLAWTAAQRFATLDSQTWDDIFQNACVGLWKAVLTYDPARGGRFSSWAVPKIITTIRDGMGPTLTNCVPLPRRAWRRVQWIKAYLSERAMHREPSPDLDTIATCLREAEERRFEKARPGLIERYRKEHGNTPSKEEVALWQREALSLLNVVEVQVLVTYATSGTALVSLSDPTSLASRDATEAKTATILDQLTSHSASAASPEVFLLHREGHQDELDQLMNALSPARRIILRLFLKGDSTEKIASTMGLPVGTVKSRLNKIRATAGELGLNEIVGSLYRNQKNEKSKDDERST